MKNTKNILLSLTLILLCAFLGYNLWKNRSQNPTSGTNDGVVVTYGDDNDFSNTPIDTMFGYKGCERAGMYRFPTGDREFVYQKYNIRIGKPAVNSIKGEKITVTTKDGGTPWEVPVPNDSHFGGYYREHMILNVGPESSKPELIFIDVKDKRASYRSAAVDTAYVLGNKFWFHVPIEESEVRKVPECPEKSEWEQKGLKTGYAQLCLYDFTNGSVTMKSEYKCYGKK